MRLPTLGQPIFFSSFAPGPLQALSVEGLQGAPRVLPQAQSTPRPGPRQTAPSEHARSRGLAEQAPGTRSHAATDGSMRTRTRGIASPAVGAGLAFFATGDGRPPSRGLAALLRSTVAISAGRTDGRVGCSPRLSNDKAPECVRGAHDGCWTWHTASRGEQVGQSSCGGSARRCASPGWLVPLASPSALSAHPFLCEPPRARIYLGSSALYSYIFISTGRQ